MKNVRISCETMSPVKIMMRFLTKDASEMIPSSVELSKYLNSLSLITPGAVENLRNVHLSTFPSFCAFGDKLR